MTAAARVRSQARSRTGNSCIHRRRVRRDGGGRGAEPVNVSATLREQPRSFDGSVLDARLTGATFVELPERLRQGGLDGVLVSAVARGSRAAQNGLQKDDVVLAATSGEFNDLGGFRASFGQAPQRLVLRVMRGNQRGDLQMQ